MDTRVTVGPPVFLQPLSALDVQWTIVENISPSFLRPSSEQHWNEKTLIPPPPPPSSPELIFALIAIIVSVGHSGNTPHLSAK